MKFRRIEAPEWREVGAELDERGCAAVESLASADTCEIIAAMYGRDNLFRNRVIMARHGFGRGEYQYFTYPLPDAVAALRAEFYPPLAAIANRWHDAIGIESRFPAEHSEFVRQCHDAGQTKPTPLILKYGPGDYNCLHQDRYGDIVFPFQMTVLLSDPRTDFTGGEFVLTEQRPRTQSRAEVVPLRQGDAVIFPVNQRPVAGSRGFYRVTLRHGVSRVRSGMRYTLGIILHDGA